MRYLLETICFYPFSSFLLRLSTNELDSVDHFFKRPLVYESFVLAVMGKSIHESFFLGLSIDDGRSSKAFLEVGLPPGLIDFRCVSMFEH